MTAQAKPSRAPDLVACMHRIPSRSESWLTLAVHEKHRADVTNANAAGAVLFVHGATLASDLFDIDASGRSWMVDLADAGFIIFALNIRGYGRSTKPSCFTQPAASNPPFARAAEVIHDIYDAIAFLLARTGRSTLHLVGGSWGSITTGLYTAALGAAKVERLILYAPIFSARNAGWLGWIEDPACPGRLHPEIGAYRLVSSEAIRTRWMAELDAAGDTTLLEPGTFAALMNAFLATDCIAFSRAPASVRVPNRTIADLLEAFTERPLYRPEDIFCPTLLIRGAHDPTSTAADADGLLARLGSGKNPL